MIVSIFFSVQVLRYYQKTGQIDVTPLTLPGGQPNDPRIRHVYLGKKVLMSYRKVFTNIRITI